MNEAYLEVLRPGINTTIQDKGRFHLYHIGITVSGAMDQSKFQISNALVNNDLNEGALEFAYQGPCLKLVNGNINIAITGNINFNILRKNSTTEEGICFKSYFLEDGDQIDKGKNFVRFVQPANKQDIKMVRWGWVEDNIITKYSTF